MDTRREHKWPQKGKRPFDPADRILPPSSALERLMQPDWEYVFREGYFQAGECLSAHLGNPAHVLRPFEGIMLPMLFNYRHFLELSLKAQITYCSAILNRPVPVRLADRCGAKDQTGPGCRYRGRTESVLEFEHGLMQLWNVAKSLLEEAFPPSPTGDGTLAAVEASLNAFHEVDRSSQTFRYASDKLGNPTSDRLPQIDIGQLRDSMQRLHAFFTGCELQAGEFLSHNSDMENDFREEMGGP